MSDEPINVEKELLEAQSQFPISLPDGPGIPLDMQMCTIALTIAQRHIGDTVVREGAMYNALKMDNKPTTPLTIDHVMQAALVFERYLWGEWSKGIAENALNSTMSKVADAVERAFKEGEENPDTQPSAGGTPPE